MVNLTALWAEGDAMNRITQKDLESVLSRINKVKGFGDKPKYSTPNSYGLDGAYGGWKLVQYVNDKGGERNITHGYLPKKELYYQMQAYLNGLANQ